MNKSIKIIINYLLGPVLFMLLSWILYRQFINQPDLDIHLRNILSSWRHPALWISFLLLFANWGLESFKWKLLVSHVEKISFLRAFKSVLAGTSVTMLTPNRIGEYAGRILFISEGNRLTAISLNVLGSIAQLLITLIMGIIGIILVRNLSLVDGTGDSIWLMFFGKLLLALSIGFTLLLGLLFFRIAWFVEMIEKAGVLKKIVKHIAVLDTFSRKQLLRILLLSLFRYMIFILQYVLLLQVFGTGISWYWCFWLLTFFYLLMAVIPSIGLSELPLRAAASTELLSVFTTNVFGIQAAAFAIWVINLVIPALMGSLLILGHRIIKEK